MPVRRSYLLLPNWDAKVALTDLCSNGLRERCRSSRFVSKNHIYFVVVYHQRILPADNSVSPQLAYDGASHRANTAW